MNYLLLQKDSIFLQCIDEEDIQAILLNGVFYKDDGTVVDKMIMVTKDGETIHIVGDFNVYVTRLYRWYKKAVKEIMSAKWS